MVKRNDRIAGALSLSGAQHAQESSGYDFWFELSACMSGIETELIVSNTAVVVKTNAE